MPEWEVIYKATADFSSLMRSAAEARAELKGLADEASKEGDIEAAAAIKAAAAHDADTEAIKRQTRAMSEASAAARSYNPQVNFGGRSSMDEHLRDLERERTYSDQLNRSRQRGFQSPQQDYAYRQQEMSQRLLWNRASTMGYQTPEQYLQYMQREQAAWQQQNDVWRTRNQLLTDGAQAAAAHASAVSGAHMGPQQLADANRGLSDYNDLLSGLPDVVVTKAAFDSAAAKASAADWQAHLASIPDTVTTRAVLDTAGISGPAAALPPTTPPEAPPPKVPEAPPPTELATPVTAAGAEAAKRDLKSLSEARRDASGEVVVRVRTVDFDKAEAQIVTLKAQLRDLQERLVTEPRINTTEFLSAARVIEDEIKRLSRDFSGLGVQPEGLKDIKKDFADVQIAAAALDPKLKSIGSGRDLEGVAGAAAGFKTAFSTIGTIVDSVWQHLKSSSTDAAQGVEGRWQNTVAHISGFFRGFATTDATSIFRGLVSATESAAQGISGGFAAISGAVLAVIQLLPALSAGLGAVGSLLFTMPGLLVAAGGGFGVFLDAIKPVMDAVGKYNALLNAQQAAQANPMQAASQNAQLQHAVAQAYQGVAEAAYQATQSQITDAHAVSDAQFSLSQSLVQAHQSQITSTHAVRDAQYALQQADWQATQTRLNDAHSVSEAQYNLQRTTVSAALQQQEAVMSVASAQHSYQDAVFSVTQAQYQLNQAWIQATRSMQDLEEQVTYASLDLRGAQLQLLQAQQAYAQVMSQSTSTALDRAEAAYQVQVAEKGLSDVQKQNTRNEQDLANARKYGAQQTFGVTSAAHALADAQFSAAQSQQQVAITEKQAAESQIQAAHSVQQAMWDLRQTLIGQAHDAITSAHDQSEAQYNLGQSYFAAQQSRVTSAHAIIDAEFALTQSQTTQGHDRITSAYAQQNAQFALQQAITQSAIASQAGGAMMVSAYQQLQTALAQLSPAARRAVGYLEPILKFFNNWKGAQQALFTQLDPALSHISTIIVPLKDMLTAMATAAGQVLAEFVTWFEKLANSPAWKVLTQSNVSIIKNLGDAFFHVVDAIVKLAVVAAPFTEWFVGEIDRLAKKFDAWATKEEALGSKSGLAKWLQASKKPLEELGHLAMSMIYFFEILAGGQPKFNQQGVLTGVIPSPQQYRNLQTFTLLLGVLANQVLPNVALALRVLAKPEMADALAKLFGALSKLILIIVSSPGFQTGFTAFLGLLSWFVNILGDIMKFPGVGDVIGGILGVLFAAITVEKLTKLGSLVTKLGDLWGWLRKLAGLDAGKIAAAEAAGAGGGGVAGGAAGGTRGGGAAGTAEKVTGIGALLGSGTALGALAAWLLGGRVHLPGAPGGENVQQGTMRSLGNLFDPSAIGKAGPWRAPFEKFFGQELPNWLGGANKGWAGLFHNINAGFNNDMHAPVVKFFGQDLPDWLGAGNKGWSGLYEKAKTKFGDDVWAPTSKFFGSQLPNFLDSGSGGWSGMWKIAKDQFTTGPFKTVSGFFGTSLPNWLTGGKSGWDGMWKDAKSTFNGQLVSDISKFFGTSLPNWLDGGKGGWHGMWKQAGIDFNNLLNTPVGNWFIHTFPNLMHEAWVTSINYVISHILNKVIGYINDVTGVVGIKIKTIPTVGMATGGPVQQMLPLVMANGGFARMPGRGSVGGAGYEDSQPTLLTPGEYVLRQPARAALERNFGAGGLSRLNHAEEYLGYQDGGYVGGFVGRGGDIPRYQGGGGVYRNPVRAIRGLTPERIDQGVDFNGSGPLYPFGPGRITAVANSGWPGGAYIDEIMSGGMYAGKHIYYAEDIRQQVHTGQQVGYDTVLGDLYNGPDGIEIGFGDGRGGTMASVYHQEAPGGDPGAHAAAFGELMNLLLTSVGAPGGRANGKPVGTIPNNWGQPGTLTLGRKAIEAVSKFLGGLGSWVGGIVHHAEAELARGARKSFDWVWAHTVLPVMEHAGVWGSGAAEHMLPHLFDAGLFNIKKLVDTKLAQAADAGTAGPTSPGVVNVAKFLMAHGMTKAAAAGVAGTVAGESGGDPEAVGSGGAGLIGWTPPTSAYPIADIVTGHPQRDMGVQLTDMLAYIQRNGSVADLNRYSDPLAAAYHFSAQYERPAVTGSDVRAEVVMSLFRQGLQGGGGVGEPAEMYGGGDVISSIIRASSNAKVRQAMGLGSWLESRWNPSAVGDGGTSFGAFQIHLPAHKGVTRAEAEDPYWAARFMEPAYRAGVTKAGWGRLPYDAEQAAFYAERPSRNYYAQEGSRAVTTGWHTALKALGFGPPAAQPQAPPTTAQAWYAALAALQSAFKGERGAENSLINRHYLRRGLSAAHWAAMRKDLTLQKSDQGKLDTAWGKLSTAANADAATIPGGDWTALDTATDKLIHDQSREAAVLRLHPSAGPRLSRAASRAKSLLSAFGKARSAWTAQYGPGGTTPGGGVTQLPGWTGPGAGVTAAAPPPVVLQIVGGPGAASYGDWSPTQLSFADGGSVGEMAAMFGGGLVPGTAYVTFPPSLLRSMSGSGTGGPPGSQRTLSEAASSIGVQVQGGITVNNPVPEPAGQSITHSVNRLAFLAGRGQA